MYLPHWPILIKVIWPTVYMIRACMIGSDSVIVVNLYERAELFPENRHKDIL
jgi:hypothetical protein